jgi:hypothetical protein
VSGPPVVAWRGGRGVRAACGLPGSVAGAVLPCLSCSTGWMRGRRRPGRRLHRGLAPQPAPHGRPAANSAVRTARALFRGPWPAPPRPVCWRGRPAAGPVPGRGPGRPRRPSSAAASGLPWAQGLVAVQGGRDAQLVQQLAVLVERGGGGGGLVRVDPDGHRHAGTFHTSGQEHTGRAGRLGASASSVEPLPVGRRQDRTAILQPTRWWQRSLWSDLPTPWNPMGCSQGSQPHSISRRSRVGEEEASSRGRRLPPGRSGSAPGRAWPPRGGGRPAPRPSPPRPG